MLILFGFVINPAHLEFVHFDRLRSAQIVPMLRLLFYMQNLMDLHKKALQETTLRSQMLMLAMVYNIFCAH